MYSPDFHVGLPSRRSERADAYRYIDTLREPAGLLTKPDRFRSREGRAGEGTGGTAPRQSRDQQVFLALLYLSPAEKLIEIRLAPVKTDHWDGALGRGGWGRGESLDGKQEGGGANERK